MVHGMALRLHSCLLIIIAEASDDTHILMLQLLYPAPHPDLQEVIQAPFEKVTQAQHGVC